MNKYLNRARAAGIVLVAQSLLIAGCAGSGAKPESSQPDPLPSDPNALILGAEVALQRKQYLDAVRAYVRAAELSEDETLSEQAARVAYQFSQWTLLLQAADRWLQLNSTSEDAHQFAGAAALHLFRTDLAADHYATLIESRFISPNAGFLELLPRMAAEGSDAATLAVLRTLVSKFPEIAESHYALAQAALDADHFELALTHAQRAREISPYWTPAAMLLARVQVMMRKTDDGLSTARAALKDQPTDQGNFEYAVLLMASGQEKEGRALLEDLANKPETSAGALRTLAILDFQTGNHEAAAQRFNALLTTGRAVYESQFHLGAMAELRNEPEDAVQAYQRVTAGDYAIAAQTRAARIRAGDGDKEAAMKVIDDFVAERPQFAVRAVQAKATLLNELDDPRGALAMLNDGVKQYPDASELRFARVFQLESQDQVDKAIDELRVLVEQRPHDPAALNALGYTLVDRTRQHREGLELIQQALALTPDSGAVLDSMGWALHKVGRNEEALSYLEKARQRTPDGEIEYHVGEVLVALGRRDEAQEVWQTAAKRFPENEDLQRKLKKQSR